MKLILALTVVSLIRASHGVIQDKAPYNQPLPRNFCSSLILLDRT